MSARNGFHFAITFSIIMKLSLFLLLIGTLALASFSQATDVETAKNPIFGNDIQITPSHMKHLKKLVYVLSEPRFNPRENAQLKDLEKLIIHIEGMKTPATGFRAQRGLDDIMKKFKKIKKILDKIFKKGKKKAKSLISEGL